jgi:hypothetical protein
MVEIYYRWMFFNYWNDDYFSQWNHQLFFSLTELASTVSVVLLADQAIPFTALRVLPVVAVATIHILVSSWDQFITNVFWGEGYSFQVPYALSHTKIMKLILVVISLICFESKK